MKPLKKAIIHFVNQFGYEILKSPKPQNPFSKAQLYEQIYPMANYSPWNKDSLFLESLSEIQAYTLVDKYRCFELWKLVEQSAKLSSGNIIEIGVWRGGTGALIAKQAKNCGIIEKVYLCDTFAGVVKASPKDTSYIGGEHSDTSRKIVEDLVHNRLHLDNVDILEGIFPDQTGSQVENLKFRLCHIDVDVYQSAKDIDNWIWDKMVTGGMIVYDDYGSSSCDGITQYVEEQMNLSDRLVIHNLNGHAIIVKL